MTKALLLASLILGGLLIQQAVAQQEDVYGPIQRKGYITNANGDKCWFKQNIKKETYLHSIPADTRTLIFDNSKCMSAEGIEYGANIMMINNFIAYPYSHDDAAFESRVEELRESSMFQIRGKCIQSATYPNIGVAVDYMMKGKFITSVKHAMTVDGCE